MSRPRSSLLTGRVVLPDAVVGDGAVAVVGDAIAFAGPAAELPVEWWSAPTPDGWPEHPTLLPGLVDGHCHGGAGGEFGPDEASARRAAEHHHRHGTTSVVGSLVSAPGGTLVAGVGTSAGLVRSGLLAGVHVEGPFLSDERRGAQDPSALTDPDLGLVERLGAAAEEAGAADALVHMTYAPERPGADRLPVALAEVGAVAALGHTDCDAATAWGALAVAGDLAPRGGRPLVTHLFNGMPPLHHRSPGPVAACLAAAARGEAYVELVGDGVHLDPLTVRMVFDLVGPEAVCLVTDAMAASGMAPGRYTLGRLEVEVKGGTARLVDGGAIAGGVATLLDIVRTTVTESDVSLADAVRAASATPTEALGLPGVGALESGNRADVLVVDDDLALVRVLRAGEWLDAAPSKP
jgi:N-acetylglucosamine-6-phosphate deacetylase